MRKTIIAVASLLLCEYEGFSQSIDYTKYVNPLMGTQSSYELSSGNTYPAIARPWGMNFWTPQTGKMGNGWTYVYNDYRIRGFKQTHQPSPWINDYGQFAIMPISSPEKFDEDIRASWFSHKAETVTPYYYQVYLADLDVSVELTPTERAAFFRLTYPTQNISYLVVDAFDQGSFIKIIPEKNMIVGYTTKNSGGVPSNFKNWFVIESDVPFLYVGTVDGSTLVEGRLKVSAEHAQGVIGFATNRTRPVNLRIASSFVSQEQAELNLKEIDQVPFEQVKKAGRDRWNDLLGRIVVEDNQIDHLRVFYSCLYRSLLFPRDLSEIDYNGNRIHYSPYNGKIESGYLFTDTGFWDTFRSLFPLLNLVYPDESVKMQQGLVNVYRESGFLPEWASPGHRGCMIGNNSASVVADAWLSGLRGYQIESLWKALIHGTNHVHPNVSSTGRLGWQYYNQLGYVPYDVNINENAARTLEYAYNDWCIYQLGRALNKSDKELAVYRERALNYQNLFDTDSGLMCGRNKNGSFQRPFNPLKWGDAFTEGNSLHYTWSVFHDPVGLIQLMGGEDSFAHSLDTVFAIPPLYDDSYYGQTIHEIREMQVMNLGNYAHGNQPIQHMVYLYDWSRQPWKTQFWVREIMERFYTPTPDGYCGDEDNGQTSAWYVFSAMGFYPVCPGSNQYAIGTPLFRKILMRLPNGKEIKIEARNISKNNRYIDSVYIGGELYSHNFFTHAMFQHSNSITFQMAETPNYKRGVLDIDRPYSFSTDY